MDASFDVDKFNQDGFVLIKGLLDKDKYIDPLKNGYRELFETLIFILLNESETPGGVKYEGFASIEDSFATLLGIGGAAAFAHIDPANCLAGDDYSLRLDFPNSQLPEIYAINFNNELLRAIRLLLGKEYFSIPYSDFSLRLNPAQQQISEQVRDAAGTPYARLDDDIYKRYVGTCAWYIPAVDDLWTSRAAESGVVHAVVFLNDSNVGNGGLKVIKGSHRIALRRRPMHDELRGTVQIEAQPGDVLLFSRRLFIGSSSNTSRDSASWHMSFRFSPKNEPRPQPFLPCFLVEGEEAPRPQVRNSMLWAATIRQALLHAEKYEFVPSMDWVAAASKSRIFRQAERTCSHWHEYQHDPIHWLSLRRYPNRRDLYARALSIIGMGPAKRSPFLIRNRKE